MRAKGSKQSSGLSCPCARLERALKDETGSSAEIAALRKQTWIPCWNCHADRGCKECRPSLETCGQCGVYVTAEAFIRQAARLPPVEFERYPAGWRLEHYAIFGVTDRAWLPYIRAHLRNPKRAALVNRVLRSMGEREFDLDAVGGAVIERD